MDSISSNMKPHCHARSISLPSTSDHQSLFIELYRFQASQKATTSCSSSSLIANKLNSLNNMYESVLPFLTFSSTQQPLSRGSHKEQQNKFLDELLGLLDLCSTTKDALSVSIDCAKELESVLRRKRGNTQGLTSSVEEYLSQRRKVKKVVSKALSGLQKHSCSSIREAQRTTSSINMLKEMRLNTLEVFEALLTLILGSNRHSKPQGWSLISKMTANKRVQCDQTLEESEVKKVDDELNVLIKYKKMKSESFVLGHIQKELGEMESSFLDLSEQVDCLCKHLIKTRVSILNMLSC